MIYFKLTIVAILFMFAFIGAIFIMDTFIGGPLGVTVAFLIQPIFLYSIFGLIDGNYLYKQKTVHRESPFKYDIENLSASEVFNRHGKK